MVNVLGNYVATLFANAALTQLKNTLGFGARIHTGYEAERQSFGKGDTIKIKKPSDFTVEDAPSTAQDLATESLTLTLTDWKEVKFKLNDKESAFVGIQGSLDHPMITQHINRAVYRLANHADLSMQNLWLDVPHYTDVTGSLASTGPADIAKLNGDMFDQQVPIDDPSMLHLQMSSTFYTEAMANLAFSQYQGAGGVGVQSQLNGTLGQKYGFETYRTQNVKTYTPGNLTDAAGAVVGAHAAGVTSVALDGLSVSESEIKQGDILEIVTGGVTYRYAVTADAATSGGGAATVSITPALRVAAADNDVATFKQDTDASAAIATLAGGFHREAFARAFAPLPDFMSGLGANVFTATDPDSGTSVRARIYYVGNSSEVHVALDYLLGYKTLDPDKARRFRNVA